MIFLRHVLSSAPPLTNNLISTISPSPPDYCSGALRPPRFQTLDLIHPTHVLSGHHSQQTRDRRMVI